MKATAILVLAAFMPMHFGLAGVGHAEELGEEQCDERVQQMLNEQPDVVVVHVKGLVCSSCGIGIRIGLAKLDGIDKTRFNKGVKLDSTQQYAVLAATKPLDFDAVAEKVYAAGYDPIHASYLENGKIQRIDLTRK